MKRIAIFASGRGSNAAAIIEYFSDRDDIEVTTILSNKQDAGVLTLAEENNIPALHFHTKGMRTDGAVLKHLADYEIDVVVLAGFLKKIPNALLEAFPNRILNIHPSLLPKYGGKGMYGHHVHQAVFDHKEVESGITIHLVNAAYDEGAILFQASVALSTEDTPERIAEKVLELEHYYFPRVVEAFIENSL